VFPADISEDAVTSLSPTAVDEQSSPGHAGPPRDVRRRRRGWIVAGCVLAVILAVVGVVAAWLGIRAFEVRGEIADAQALVPEIIASAAGFDFVAVEAQFEEVASHTAKAAELTSDSTWHAAEALPLVGQMFSTTGELAKLTNEAVLAVEPLARIAPEFEPSKLAPQNGAIPLGPLTTAAPVVQTALVDTALLQERLAAVDLSGAPSEIVGAQAQLGEVIASLSEALGAADTVLQVAPRMLGAAGPQTYVMMFQNNAEARSLGGTALSLMELRLDQGRIELVRALPAGWGNFDQTPDEPIIPAPEGFAQFAPGEFGTYIPNATLRPSFVSAAQIVQANWLREFGYSPDAVIGADVVGLSYLLRATGPVTTTTGHTVDASNLVPVLLNGVLQEFNTGDVRRDNELQDVVYADVVAQTFARATSGDLDVTELFSAVMQAAGEHRLLVWSAHEDLEAVFVEAGADAGIPDSDGETDRFGFYINDNVGSKLNYYLATAVDVASGQCKPTGTATRRLTLTLTSTLPPDAVVNLSPSVTGNFESEQLAPGVQRIKVYAYAPTNGSIVAASVNGTAVPLDGFSDDGHQVQFFWVSVDPGASVALAVDLETGSPSGTPLDVRVTPGVNATVQTDSELDCTAAP